MMRLIVYVILLYILLPVNASIDLIAILIFFVAFRENELAALLYAFSAGLLIDLYYPILFGINMLTYVVLVQAVLYLKKYFTESPFIIWIAFTAFYLTRIFVTYVFVSPSVHVPLYALTIVFALPVFLVLNRTMYGVWMKT
jgi:rod shape-determining protein MreD